MHVRSRLNNPKFTFWKTISYLLHLHLFHHHYVVKKKSHWWDLKKKGFENIIIEKTSGKLLIEAIENKISCSQPKSLFPSCLLSQSNFKND